MNSWWELVTENQLICLQEKKEGLVVFTSITGARWCGMASHCLSMLDLLLKLPAIDYGHASTVTHIINSLKNDIHNGTVHDSLSVG